MKRKIYFSDLTHTSKGLHSPTFPLGISNVMSYAKQELGESDFQFHLFKFPEKLMEAIQADMPDILCMSNFSWNLELNYKIASLAKALNPALIVIMGGPNFPIDASEKLQFFKRYPLTDFYIEMEGEVGLATLIKKLDSHYFEINRLKDHGERSINCNYLVGDQLIQGPAERIKDVNIIPSPYLSGILDEFFDDNLLPMFETVRGCPFSCTFCADGLTFKSKVRRYNPEKVKEEINYIASRVYKVDEMILTDLNFGMYNDDVTTAEALAEVQKKYNWPIMLSTSAGKNKPDKVIRVASILNGSWKIGSSIQSSDPDVLDNVKRSNISREAFQQFNDFNNSLSKDANPYTDVMLGLPGDTKEKHFNSLRYGIDRKVKVVRMFQSILLAGTSLAAPATRKQFGLKPKYRALPGCVGIYKFGDEEFTIAELEEIITSSNSLTFDDYIECRIMDLIIEAFYNNSLFDEVYTLVEQLGGSVFESLLYFNEHKEMYTPKMKEIFKGFVDATKEVLYNNREESLDFILKRENTEKYLKGELGINEMLEYTAILYQELDNISVVFFKAVKGYLEEKGLLLERLDQYFEQLRFFIICRKQEFYETNQINHQDFDYDFQALEQIDYDLSASSPENFRKKVRYKFFHTEKQKKNIEHSINVYSQTPSGIGRTIQRSKLKTMFRQFELTTE